MTRSEIHDALKQAVHEVLETMFFVRQIDDSVGPAASPESDLFVQLHFEGSPGGQLTLSLGRDAARAIAADFLGSEEDELSGRQVEEVACELANMICGSVLSRTESETRFCLSSPFIIPANRATFSPEESMHAVGIDHGALTVYLILRPVADGVEATSAACLAEA